MKSINEIYGGKIERRAKDKKTIEKAYKEGLVYLINEEIDEWIDICSKIRTGECNYDLKSAIRQLGELVKERDSLLEDIADLNGENDEIY